MNEHTITLGGETFRLYYNTKTSALLLETQRPDNTIFQLLDSNRLGDMILLTVAGMDETHEKDKRKQLTTTALQRIAERVGDLVDQEVENGVEWRHLFLPVKRAIGASGIAGLILDFDEDGSVRAPKAQPSSVPAAS